MPTPDQPMPVLTWGQMESVLLSLATTPNTQLIARHLLSGLRKQSTFLAPEGVYRELCFTAAALLDTSFGRSELDTNRSSASCSCSPSPP